MGDNRPPIYIEDGILIIRASALGHPCLWELIAAGQGEEMQPIPRVLQRAFDEGNLLEPVIVKRAEQERWVIFDSHQSEGHLWLSENVAVRYHSDGIGWKNDSTYKGYVVVEIKALSDALWQTFVKYGMAAVIPEYEWQLSAMMHGEAKPGLWIGYNKGLPPDENGNRQPCEDAGKIHVQFVEEPPIPFLDIQLKASLIKEGVYGEPIISSDTQCGSPDYWPCRYLHIRPEPEDASTARAVFIPDQEQSAEVDRLIVEFLSYKGRYDEAKQGYERSRDELLRLAGNETGFIQTDRWFVPIHNGSGQSRLAMDEMSQELKQVVEKYRRPGKKYRYLMTKTIKRLGF